MMTNNCQCSEPWFDPELGDHLMGCVVAYGAMDLGDEDVVYGVSNYYGPWDGWETNMVTTSKKRAWEKYREALTNPLEYGADRYRIIVWRNGVVSGILVESEEVTRDWKRLY